MKNENPAKIYRISPLRRGLFSGIWVLFSLLLLVLSAAENDPASRSALHITAAIVLAIGAAMTPLVWYTRLTVASGGIELRQFGWRARVDWDNVAAIVRDAGAFGLVLKKPMNRSASLGLRVGILIPGWYTSQQAAMVQNGRWLPLEAFAWSWRRGPLRRDFQSYAPTLPVSEKAF
ncbi:MAG: hypothetical protein ABFD97_24585 [Syntrophobacter sp.]